MTFYFEKQENGIYACTNNGKKFATPEEISDYAKEVVLEYAKLLKEGHQDKVNFTVVMSYQEGDTYS